MVFKDTLVVIFGSNLRTRICAQTKTKLNKTLKVMLNYVVAVIVSLF